MDNKNLLNEMFGDEWLTTYEVMQHLNISRSYVYTLAKRYKWETGKIGNMRYFCAADVVSTPDADERQRAGYKERSTRVEKKGKLKMIELSNETYLTTSETADLTGYTESYLQTLAKNGTISAVKIGNAWAIEKSSLLKFGKKQEPKQKPQKKQSVSLRLKAMQLGHKLYKSPDGRVYCTKCQLTVTQIKGRCK